MHTKAAIGPTHRDVATLRLSVLGMRDVLHIARERDVASDLRGNVKGELR
jgi:hypothetical protein